MAEQSIETERFKREQKRDWDATAAGWKKWWPLFERSAQHVSDRLVELAKIGPGARVLEIATGSGEPAVTAARQVAPNGRVIATDQSPGMLAVARERAAALGITNVEFRETDGETLNLSERDFDAVLCRWGLMFMPNLDHVLAGLRARLVASGWLATAVWSTADRVPMITAGAETVRKLAGLPPASPGAFDPLRLADTSILSSALIEAGFKDVAVERLPVTFEFDSPKDFTRFREEVSSPFRALLERQTPELRRQILEAVTDAARAYAVADGRVSTTNETILFSAHT